MANMTIGKMGMKGHLVMPQRIRKKLGLEQGSSVAWIVKEDGEVSIQAVSPPAQGEHSEFDAALKNMGMTYEEWRTRRSEFARKWMKEKYNIDVDALPNGKAVS